MFCKSNLFIKYGKLRRILFIKIELKVDGALSLSDDLVCFEELLHSASNLIFEGAHPAIHSADHFLNIERLSENQFTALSHSLDASLADAEIEDLGEAFPEIFLQVCATGHKIE